MPEIRKIARSLQGLFAGNRIVTDIAPASFTLKRTVLRKVIVGVLFLSVLLIAAVLGLVWAALSASLPTLDGNFEVVGLGAPVEAERDSPGVPTIPGENRKDVAYATGLVHAQEVCAAIGQATRQYDAAVAALEAGTGKE